MAQTAVGWLVKKLEESGIPLMKDELEMIQHAKQMEKEQSKQDYDAGLFDGTMDEVKDRLHKNAEQYYNETYGTVNSNEVSD
jgi:hypothetical protein